VVCGLSPIVCLPIIYNLFTSPPYAINFLPLKSRHNLKEVSMKNIIQKLLLAISAAALVFAAFPVTSAYAADEAPPIAGEVSN
jgi:hypothetical protein